MNREQLQTVFLGLVALFLVACGGASAPVTMVDVLPLDADRPTFLYFYTDN